MHKHVIFIICNYKMCITYIYIYIISYKSQDFCICWEKYRIDLSFLKLTVAIGQYIRIAGPQAWFPQNPHCKFSNTLLNQGILNNIRNLGMNSPGKCLKRYGNSQLHRSKKTGILKNAFIYFIHNEEKWILFPFYMQRYRWKIHFNWLASLKRITSWSAFQKQKSMAMRHWCQDFCETQNLYSNACCVNLFSSVNLLAFSEACVRPYTKNSVLVTTIFCFVSFLLLIL